MQATISKAPITWSGSLPNVPGLAGAVAGGFAGAVTVLLSLVIKNATNGNAATLLDQGVVAIDRVGAFTLSSSDALIASALLCVVGWATLGAIFGVVYRRVLRLTTDFGLPVYAGLAYGMIVYVIISFVLPIVDPLLATSAHLGTLIAQTLVFGIVLGLVYTALRPLPYTNTHEYV